MRLERHRARIDGGLGELVDDLQRRGGWFHSHLTVDQDRAIPPWAVDLVFAMP